MNTTIRPGTRKFYDDINFSRGIERSGFFTISETKNLIEYGVTLQNLLNSKLPPSNDEESLFINTIENNEKSDNYMVNLWIKYINAVKATKRRVSAEGGGKYIGNTVTISANEVDDLIEEESDIETNVETVLDKD